MFDYLNFSDQSTFVVVPPFCSYPAEALTVESFSQTSICLSSLSTQPIHLLIWNLNYLLPTILLPILSCHLVNRIVVYRVQLHLIGRCHHLGQTQDTFGSSPYM